MNELDARKLADDLRKARKDLEETVVAKWNDVDTILKRMEKELRNLPSYNKAKKAREAGD
jgi:hypothetical protein